MTMMLTLAYLFFIGSVFGWVLEVFFRRFFSSSNPQRKWINPGFCTGPYLPLYGCGLCILFLIAYFSTVYELNLVYTIVAMVISMTLIEYIAGLIALKLFKLRLWDYRGMWGNINGLICPLFSFFWGVLGIAYLFFVHPYILDALAWLSQNLAFSFVIGFFFGVFTLDVVHSADLVVKFKKELEDKQVVLKLEHLKSHVAQLNEEARSKANFLFFFKSTFSPSEIIRKIENYNKLSEAFEHTKKDKTAHS